MDITYRQTLKPIHAKYIYPLITIIFSRTFGIGRTLLKNNLFVFLFCFIKNKEKIFLPFVGFKLKLLENHGLGCLG